MAFVVKRLFADELYFNKALSVYAYNDIPFSFKWVGYIGENGQEENTGKDALNKAVQFLIGRNSPMKNICLFDCDTNRKAIQKNKESKKIEKLDEDARREEKEFSEIDPEKSALRAEKMFRMNQKELMRYYDMNLAQTKFLSGLGIMMIIFGILIAVASLYMYMSSGADKILLFVGSLSGIMDFAVM